MSESQVRWGILGSSNISQVMVRAMHESKISRPVAVASRSLDKAKQFAAQFSLPHYYDDYDALLANEEIDVVYIGLPNHLHKEWTLRAALAGKHILCEKPFVTNLQDAQETFSVVKKSNVFCTEALMYRYHPFTAKLCEIIASKIIGEIRFFNAVYTASIAAVANTTEGGSILNLGCYPVSLIRLLAGCAHGKLTAEPSDVVSIGELDGKTGNDTRASLLMHFPNQMMAMVTTADDMQMVAQLDIYGTEGHIKLLSNPWLPERENNALQIYRNDQREPLTLNVTADQSLYCYQIDAVSRQIMQGDREASHDCVSWLDTLGNTIVLEAWLKQVKAKNVTVNQETHAHQGLNEAGSVSGKIASTA